MMNRKPDRIRSLTGTLFLAALPFLILLFALAGRPAATALAQEPDSADDTVMEEKGADVIVQFGDTDVAARPITFTTPISGLRALELSGLQFETVDFGGGFIGVCSIEGVGCPATTADCFCGGSTYWGYNYWDGASWQGYPVGAATSVISQTGAIEGWRWGEFGDPMIPASRALAAERDLSWLQGTQDASGGFGSAGGTVETMLAMGANRLSASDWITAGDKSLMDFWMADDIADDEYANNAAKFISTSAAATGKLILAAAGLGEDVGSFAGVNLADSLMGYYNSGTGAFGSTNWDQGLGMLGWSAAYTEPVPAKAVEILATNVISDGGWGYLPGGESDTNSTALMLQALRAAGQCERTPLVTNALAYFKALQNADGGFAFAAGYDSDANSTAYVIQGLLAAGENPVGPRWTTADGKTPYDALASFQLPDGSFEWMAGQGSNALATQQAVAPLLNADFPLQREIATCTDIYLPIVGK
jgi:hypothetical protein